MFEQNTNNTNNTSFDSANTHTESIHNNSADNGYVSAESIGNPSENIPSSDTAPSYQAPVQSPVEGASQPQAQVYPNADVYTPSMHSESYEWNSENDYLGQSTSDSDKKKESSQKGFKVFLGVILSVFTLSVIVMTVMVADYIGDGRNNTIRGFDSKVLPHVTEGENSSAPSKSNPITTNPESYALVDPSLEGQILTIPQIAAKCSPSSVGIISEVEVSYSSFPFYFTPSTGVSTASGSGFIYSNDGYIITNHHVIEDAKKITVVLHDKTEVEATLVGSDELSDIAVLKITPPEGTALIPMEVGNSDELVVGESVVAIGCPAGIEFLGTVTDGIVSSINRDVEITDSFGSVQKTMTLIQTNATINHGNSGGPLINTRGQVIGINTLKLTADYEGIGFSIPMNGAMPIIRQLIEHGKVVERTEEDFAYGKGIIGINGSAISKDEAEHYGIPQGVLVVQINREGSAAKAGLRRGDIITHYNGKEVKTIDEINAAKGSARAGETVTLTVYRDGDDNTGETLDITFKLDAQ